MVKLPSRGMVRVYSMRVSVFGANPRRFALPIASLIKKRDYGSP